MQPKKDITEGSGETEEALPWEVKVDLKEWVQEVGFQVHGVEIAPLMEEEVEVEQVEEVMVAKVVLAVWVVLEEVLQEGQPGLAEWAPLLMAAFQDISLRWDPVVAEVVEQVEGIQAAVHQECRLALGAEASF
jgi:hypothetical protein